MCWASFLLVTEEFIPSAPPLFFNFSMWRNEVKFSFGEQCPSTDSPRECVGVCVSLLLWGSSSVLAPHALGPGRYQRVSVWVVAPSLLIPTSPSRVNYGFGLSGPRPGLGSCLIRKRDLFQFSSQDLFVGLLQQGAHQLGLPSSFPSLTRLNSLDCTSSWQALVLSFLVLT